MTTKPCVCVVIFVSNVAKISDFYRNVISMNVAHAEDRYAVLTIPGLELVIHGIPGAESDGVEAQIAPSPREDSYIKVCLPVDNIAAARKQAQGLGGYVKPPEFEWESEGVRACDGHDPEGNVFQVRAASGEAA